MKRFFSRAVCALLVLFPFQVGAQDGGPYDPSQLRILLGSDGNLRTIQEAYEDLDSVRRTLETHEPGACSDKANLTDCIDAFEAAALQKGGLYAAFAQQAAFIARSTLDAEGSFKSLEAAPTVSGQINEYCLSSPTQRGFYFLPPGVTSGGSFSVLCVTVITKTASLGANKSRELYQYYLVRIDDWGWDNRGNDPSNIFPAAAKATGLRVAASAANQDFLIKLYAAGEQIRVLNYWRSTDGSNWEKYDASSTQPKGIENIFKVNPDACVDMLFVKEPPMIDGAFSLPNDWQGGTNYCLGRCKEPPIINTQ